MNRSVVQLACPSAEEMFQVIVNNHDNFNTGMGNENLLYSTQIFLPGHPGINICLKNPDLVSLHIWESW